MHLNNKKNAVTTTMTWAIFACICIFLAFFNLSARKLGLSMRSQFLRVVILPVLFRKSNDETTKTENLVARDRALGPVPPSSAFCKKFNVREDKLCTKSVFVVSSQKKPKGKLYIPISPIKKPKGKLHILFLHGGSYIYDVSKLHWVMVEELIERTEATIVIPVYPLAPENSWRAAFALINDLYAKLVREVGNENIVIAGDSAGGGLTLAFTQELRNKDQPLPAALVLFSPWLDLTLCEPSQVQLEKKDPLLSIAGLRRAGLMWAGETPPEDWHVSPLFGSLVGLPPIAVFTGTADLLNADANRLATKAREVGATLSLYEYPHQFHTWMAALPKLIPEANRAFEQTSHFIKEFTGREIE